MTNEKTDEPYRIVIKTLLRHTSMPFLELVALTPIREDEVGAIVERLENERLVSVRDKGNTVQEIVTIKPERYDALIREYGK